MRISVLMASRGRATQMVAALNSLRSQESGKNEVIYGVACDADDTVTVGTCQILKPRMPLCHHVLERTPSLGGRINQLAEHMPADVYVSVADDTLCMTQDWDERVAEAWRANDKGVWWWTMFHKEPALYTIVSEKWRAAAGQLFTDHFPYWFDDIWLLELWVLATESPFQFVDAKLADCPTKTMRMRDLAFWHEFWHYTRPQRIKDAKAIAAKLGLREPLCADILATVIGRPVPEFVNSMAMIEANQGDQGPATIEYVKAKSRAQEIMGQPQDIVHVRAEVLRAVKPLIEEFDRAMGINQPAAA
jgi:hypothetical protein